VAVAMHCNLRPACEHVPHIALRSGIIFTKFEVGQPIRSCLRPIAVYCWYLTLRCDLDLWPVDCEHCKFTLSAVTWSNSEPNSIQIERLFGRVIAIDLMTFNMWHMLLSALQG